MKVLFKFFFDLKMKPESIEEWEEYYLSGQPLNYKPNRPHMSELLNIFPEAKSIVRRNYLEAKEKLQKEKKKRKEQLEKALQEIYMSDASEEKKELGTYVATKWIYDLNIDPLEARCSHFDKILKMIEWKDRPIKNGTITDKDIAMAKEVPIEQFIKVGRNGFAKCIFHSEKTGSMKIYKEDNRFHCFGCSKNGDSIDFIMQQEGLDFINAVKFLIK